LLEFVRARSGQPDGSGRTRDEALQRLLTG